MAEPQDTQSCPAGSALPSPASSRHYRVEHNLWHGRAQLACFNFFGTVVKDGLAPFVSVYLVSALGWDPGRAGIVWFARDISKLIAQAPAGQLVDISEWKRTLLCVSVVCATVPAVSIIWWNSFTWMICKAIIEGIASAILEPAKAAVVLGIVGPSQFDRASQVNEMCDHAGTFFCAISAGVVAYFSPDQSYLFIIIGAMGLLATISILVIPTHVRDANGTMVRTIDDSIARGSPSKKRDKDFKAKSVCSLLQNVNIPIFAACCFFFHLCNAAILPLLSQFIAISGDERAGLPYTAANIAVAQVSAIFFAWMMGKMIERGNHYHMPVAIGFGSLPIRCGTILVLIYAWPKPYALIATQVLDGVGAGVYGLAQITVTRALTQGTGRYSTTLGLIMASHAAGAALSNLIAGYVVHLTSYHAGFVFLGCVGFIPLALLMFLRVPRVQQESGA